MVSTRSSSAALLTPRTGRSSSPPPPLPPSSTTLAKTRTRQTPSSSSQPGWCHVPSSLALIWLYISIPLVIWDMGYVFLRPYSMVGGSLHWPVWSLYAIQAELDQTYGFKEWNAGGGWNYAQSTGNLVESAAYLAYLGLYWRNKRVLNVAGQQKDGLTGRTAAVAVLVGFSAVLSTFYKTVLYWFNEAFTGFDNIGHNPPAKLFFGWVIPNGAWIVFPAILIYQFGAEIVNGLTKASTTSGRGPKSE